MDLKSELLTVLDNPASVWDAVLANLANEPRLSLLVFTTCKTPVSMIAWQEAVARLSPDAALRFEASLRVLDDSFVRVSKVGATRSRGAYWNVEFRNPSMDDFCAGYLNRNVGIISNIVDRKPSIKQIKRLVELGTAFVSRYRYDSLPRDRQHANIYETIIAKPTLLLGRLLELLPAESTVPASSAEVMKTILTVMSQARETPNPDFEKVRRHIVPLIKTLRFGAPHDSFLYAALDDTPRAKVLYRLLGQDFEEFYRSLALSASELLHFDSLVNFDGALGRSPADAHWAEEFEDLTDDWLQAQMDSEEVDSARDTYNKIVQHLELDGRSTEWDEKYDAAVRSEKSEDEDEPDDDWRDRSTNDRDLAELRDSYLIDNMFSSFRDFD